MPPPVRVAVFFFAGDKISPEKFVYMEQNCYLCDVVSNTRTFIYFMKYSELEAELTAAGCRVVRKGGNHLIWFSPITGKKFPLGHHGAKEVPPSTARSVRRLAGLKKS